MCNRTNIRGERSGAKAKVLYLGAASRRKTSLGAKTSVARSISVETKSLSVRANHGGPIHGIDSDVRFSLSMVAVVNFHCAARACYLFYGVLNFS